MRLPSRSWAGLLLLATAEGCHQTPTGAASAAFVRPPGTDVPLRDARELKLEAPMDAFADAKPIEPLAMPRYPQRALAARAGDVTVRMDVTVGVDGMVAAAEPDPLDLSGLSRFRDDFLAAVREAVKAWRFEPAAIEHLEPSASGQPVVTGITPQERGYVVEFKFAESGAVSRSFAGH